MHLNTRYRYRFSACIGFLIFCLFSSVHAKAQGSLLINPKRVIFADQKRYQEINLANIGKDSARYVISLIQIRMKTDGSFEQITEADPGQNFADKNLRVFPRTVTLAPNEAQIVKLQLSQVNKLLPGEYRSHLYFRALSEEKPLGEKAAVSDPESLSVRLTAVFGISIPVIIRVGESTAAVKLSDIELEKTDGQESILKVRFNRTGNMSVYGDLAVEHISREGKITRVGIVKGISVYTPNTVRDMKIKLDTETGVNYHSGKLRVTYTSQVEEKAEKLANAEVLLK